MAMPTLLDIAIANEADPVVGLIEESIQATPEVLNGAARTVPGITYSTWVRTSIPTASFRSANEGSAGVKSTFENRIVGMYPLNPRWECDKIIADAFVDGAQAYIALEGIALTKAAMRTLAKQFYYGATSNGDAKGHPGLLQAYDATNMVVDAGGSTDSVASSVWAVKFGPQDVQWVYGLDGTLDLSIVTEQRVTDGSGNPFTAYCQELLARVGVQVGSKVCSARIKKLTTDTGKGLTDALISELLSKFPVGVKPDYLFMSRRSQMQLQKSRTATNATGAPAPIPMESFNIPIEATDAILDTETIAL